MKKLSDVLVILLTASLGYFSPYLLDAPYNLETAFEQRFILDRREVSIEADISGGISEKDDAIEYWYLFDAPQNYQELRTKQESNGFSLDFSKYKNDFDLVSLDRDFKIVEKNSRNVLPNLRVVVRGTIKAEVTGKITNCFGGFMNQLEVHEIRRIGEVKHIEAEMDTP